MLFIQAMNVHQGGGLSLLLPLLDAAAAAGPTVALLDQRLEGSRNLPPGLQVRWVPPSIGERIKAERWLRVQVTAGDVVFCFGNLPPLRRLPCRVVLFVQNRLLIEKVELGMFGWKTRLRLHIERQWLARAASNADSFIVQTPTMRRLLCQALAIAPAQVSVCPFSAMPSQAAADAVPAPVDSAAPARFIYPASGDAHKNHRVLVDAWAMLKNAGARPVLHLTVDQRIYPELAAWIDTQRAQNDLAIVNHGHVAPTRLAELYGEATALVFPSLLESFGLPLLEASNAGLPVIAAELDYVRDVVEPVQSFDPHSPVSLARAIRRFLGHSPDTVNLVSASDLMKLVLA
jgi:glycosyltransferase involved in cell wall biosynthesis